MESPIYRSPATAGSVNTNPTAGSRKGYDLPFSKKFHVYLRERVHEAARFTRFDYTDIFSPAMGAIMRYARTGETPSELLRMEIHLIFLILRPEIDRAIARSTAARKRAALRRQKQNAPANDASPDQPATPTAPTPQQPHYTTAHTAPPAGCISGPDITTKGHGKSHPLSGLNNPRTHFL